MKKFTIILALLIPALTFTQTEIDTIVVKSNNWEIYGTVLAYDDNTLSFKPLGISKVKEIKNVLVREIRFYNGEVRNFDKKPEVILPAVVEKQADTSKTEEEIPITGSPDIIITDILDDFLLFLSSGELVRLYGLKEISLMDSRKPPKYISYQTYLYLIDKKIKSLILFFLTFVDYRNEKIYNEFDRSRFLLSIFLMGKSKFLSLPSFGKSEFNAGSK